MNCTPGHHLTALLQPARIPCSTYYYWGPNIFKKNSQSIWITSITNGSRSNEKAWIQYNTGFMPGKLLHDVLLSDFWGHIKMSGRFTWVVFRIGWFEAEELLYENRHSFLNLEGHFTMEYEPRRERNQNRCQDGGLTTDPDMINRSFGAYPSDE